MQSPLHVLIVINDSTNTGAPNQVLILARGLQKEFNVSVCCPSGWLSDQLKESGIEQHPWLEGGLGSQKAYLSELYFKLKPGIIHCHGVRAGIAGRLAARPVESKMVYTEHLWTKDFHLVNFFREMVQHYYLTKAARRGDWTVAVSHAVADFVQQKHRVSKKQLSVISCAITPVDSPEIPLEPVVGTLGRITVVKGVPILLRAIAEVAKEIPAVRCVISGEGPELQPCKDLAEQLSITDRCQWLGQVKTVTDFFDRIQIYVQPSISESFGLAAGEAMSCGRATIASNVGGLKELVEDSKSGLLFPANDVPALATAIKRLVVDLSLRGALSVVGRARVKQFSSERYLHEHQQLYKGLMHETTS